MIRSSLTSCFRVGGLAASAALLAGCMTAKLEESRTLPSVIAGGESVVILAKPHVDGVSSEDEFMDCVGRKLNAEAGIPVQMVDVLTGTILFFLAIDVLIRKWFRIRSAAGSGTSELATITQSYGGSS